MPETASPPAPAAPPAPRKREAERAEPPLDAERLAEEVRAVDRARALVAQGRAADALAALDDYDHRFAIRRFAPEALYLRMEAELTAGRKPAARETAERLLTRYPKSPQAPRARQVLDATNP
jgi:TolA-binding protein